MDFLWRRCQHSAISQQTKRVATMDMNNKKIKRFWTGSDTFIIVTKVIETQMMVDATIEGFPFL